MVSSKLSSQDRAYFVFGANGRFGSSFSQILINERFDVRRYGSVDFERGLFDVGENLKNGQKCTLIWCFGRGSSFRGEEKKSHEYQMLQSLHLTLLRISKTPNLSQFVYISTGGKMYGVNPGKITEASNISPVGSYGYEKKRCEDLIRENISNVFGQTIIFRVANAYTFSLLNEKPQGIVENCLYAIRNNTNINLTVNSSSRRQYASHFDYAKAILSQTKFLEENICQNTFNLGPDFSYDIAQIIDIFESHFKRKICFNIRDSDTFPHDSILLECKSSICINSQIDWKTIEENLKFL